MLRQGDTQRFSSLANMHMESYRTKHKKLVSREILTLLTVFLTLAVLLVLKIEVSRQSKKNLAVKHVDVEEISISCQNMHENTPEQEQFEMSDTKSIPTTHFSTFMPQSTETENWLILGFTDKEHLPVAKIWFMQLKSLGYKNHKIAMFDSETYNSLKKHKDFSTSVILASGTDSQTFFQRKISTIVDYLQAKINVFMTNIDSVWLKHRDLRNLPINVDIFHTDGYPNPNEVASKWHDVYEKAFTLSSQSVGFRATENCIKMTKKWLDFYNQKLVFTGMDFKQIEKTSEFSDTQVLLNHLYAYYFDIEWSHIPGFTGVYGKLRKHSNKNIDFDLNVMVFDPLKVIKGGQPYNCLLPRAHKPWIMNPRNVFKGVRNQLGMFYVYRDCMSPNEYRQN